MVRRNTLQVRGVDFSKDSVTVLFSDGTEAVYTAEELLNLRPNRGLPDGRDTTADVIVRRSES